MILFREIWDFFLRVVLLLLLFFKQTRKLFFSETAVIFRIRRVHFCLRSISSKQEEIIDPQLVMQPCTLHSRD